MTIQAAEKKQEPAKTPETAVEENNNAATKGSEQSNATSKESVQVPTQDKTTSNPKVEEKPVVKTPETSQTTQSAPVNSQQSQASTVKEQPKQQVNDSIMMQVVNLTNKEREKAGLQPLQVDSALMASAQEKSLDMKNNNYFSHQSPTLGSPFDQMKNRGIMDICFKKYGYDIEPYFKTKKILKSY